MPGRSNQQNGYSDKQANEAGELRREARNGPKDLTKQAEEAVFGTDDKLAAGMEKEAHAMEKHMSPLHATQKGAGAITAPAKELASTPAKVVGGNDSKKDAGSNAPNPFDMKPSMKRK